MFEVKVMEPSSSEFKINFVQCSKCGGVVGVLDYFNIGYLIQRQNEVLTSIGDALNI